MLKLNISFGLLPVACLPYHNSLKPGICECFYTLVAAAMFLLTTNPGGGKSFNPHRLCYIMVKRSGTIGKNHI